MRCILLLAIGVFLTCPAVAEGKFALVIGNSEYQNSNWRLENPKNDARLISTTLTSIGFEVETVYDADEESMKSAFRAYGERLREAGPSAVGVLFYAGHAIQSDGYNFLIPVDSKARTEQDIWADIIRCQQRRDPLVLDC
jgi:uncharacterized caspase-like protein